MLAVRAVLTAFIFLLGCCIFLTPLYPAEQIKLLGEMVEGEGEANQMEVRVLTKTQWTQTLIIPSCSLVIKKRLRIEHLIP